MREEKIIVHIIFCVLLCMVSCSTAAAQALYKGGSNVQLLYGSDFKPTGVDITTLTLEHAGSVGFFEQFGFSDVYYESEPKDINLYIEWYPKISWNRALGKELKAGPLSDVLLGGGLNVLFGEGGDFFVYVAGPVWQFDIPGLDLFQLETYYYRQRDFGDNSFRGTYQITPTWDTVIPLSEKIKLRARGFVDFIGDRGPGKSQIVAQPQLLLDLGNLWTKPGNFYAGTEWRYWHNKGGTDGITESVPQLELMFAF